jgi:hypothetical protein
MQDKTYQTPTLLSQIVGRCTDELEAIAAETFGEGPVVEKFKNRIQEAYGLRQLASEEIQLDVFIRKRLVLLQPAFAHRQVDITTRLNTTPPVYLPPDSLPKIFDGLLKNAIENTPDEGQIEIVITNKEEGTLLEVRDFGVGITKENQTRIFEGFFTTQETLDYSSKKPYDFNAGGKENQTRIFEGFFTTQETMDYSSKKPYDFNAGGKGADLLRMKIFSERYGFKIALKSSRCPLLANDADACPGRISRCPHCQKNRSCHQSAATIFSLYFPPPASSP